MRNLLVGGAWGLFILFGVVRPSFAYDIVDPNHLMDQLDAYLAQSSFSNAYKIGDVADYTRLGKDCQVMCSPSSADVIGGCGSMCTNVSEPMYRKVTAIANDQATLDLDDGTAEVWSQQQFSDMHGDSVRYIAQQLNFGVQGQLQAFQFNDKTYTLPSGKAIQGKEIVFQLAIPNYGTPFLVRFTVSKDVPFAAQVLQMAAFGQWMYNLQDFSRQ